MLTAMLAVQNLLDGAEHDLWSVNTDAEYHEEGRHRRRASVLPELALRRPDAPPA